MILVAYQFWEMLALTQLLSALLVVPLFFAASHFLCFPRSTPRPKWKFFLWVFAGLSLLITSLLALDWSYCVTLQLTDAYRASQTINGLVWRFSPIATSNPGGMNDAGFVVALVAAAASNALIFRAAFLIREGRLFPRPEAK